MQHSFLLPHPHRQVVCLTRQNNFQTTSPCRLDTSKKPQMQIFSSILNQSYTDEKIDEKNSIIQG